MATSNAIDVPIEEVTLTFEERPANSWDDLADKHSRQQTGHSYIGKIVGYPVKLDGYGTMVVLIYEQLQTGSVIFDFGISYCAAAAIMPEESVQRILPRVTELAMQHGVAKPTVVCGNYYLWDSPPSAQQTYSLFA